MGGDQQRRHDRPQLGRGQRRQHGSGQYQVIFNRNVTNCAYVGSLGDAATSVSLGFFSAVRRFNNVNGIFVETANTAGTLVNLPFHVAVFC